jgi:hypothetical protein
MRAVLDVLSALGEVEWVRCVGGTVPLRPPFVAWRFKTPDRTTEERIVEAVQSYRGSTAWVMRKGERNWVIEPADFAAYATKFRVDVEALQSFGTECPSETRQALEDATNLANYLRERLLPH